MERQHRTPRPDWQRRMEEIGFLFHTLDGTYWDERACYRFTNCQVDELEAATNELQAMCAEAVERIVRDDMFERLVIPPAYASLIEDSWRQCQPALYGRFDFCYDGQRPPKLLEYNADTPTALLEASVAQWYWLQDIDSGKDQFNSIHECLIARWKEIAGRLPVAATVHFICAQENLEDYSTTEYLRDTAQQAGLATATLDIAQVGLNPDTGAFVDAEEEPISAMFKLYPWEWLIREEFGSYLLTYQGRIFEPAWKMVLSNKGILPILWELFPGHPNLIPSYFSQEKLGDRYVRKPLLSREGANVSIVTPATRIDSAGEYGSEGYIYQEYWPIPSFDGNFTVIGSWVIGDESAGIGVREDDSLITKNTSRFVPHYFD